MTPHQHLHAAIAEALGLPVRRSRVHVAEALGIPPTTYTGWVASTGPKALGALVQAAQAAGVVVWLETGQDGERVRRELPPPQGETDADR